MPKCSFCKSAIPPGRGKMFVKSTGKVYYFCSRKCERSFFMGRKPSKIKWAAKKS